ncbi:MAG TPA: ATP-binding protein [Ruminiclostridium sp.]|nr:ATP-binding protein [Ruminiclostridium sp.]
MNEAKIIRKQQLLNMVYNMITFTIIFIMFGTIILTLFRASIYTMLDSELKTSLKSMENIIIDRNMNFAKQPGQNFKTRNNSVTYLRSPRIIPIVRDAGGNIVKFGSVNNSYYEQYLKYLSFDKENLDRIVPISIKSQYHFRSITTKIKTETGQELYLQLVINSDGERALLHHISITLGTFLVIFSILSILASYILSQMTMKPVRKSWSKQVEFVENVSHELRTPLTIIQNSLELLLTAPNEKIIDRSESVALALDETTRLSKLVADLLTLARSDSTLTEIKKDLFSIDRLVEKVCQPYIELADVQNKVFSVELKSQINITADKDRIHQLLVILLDNALKYTGDNDSISVSTTYRDNKAIITVSDTGMGISDESMEKVFDRFYREDKARSREGGGMGLGLSIARWIVEKHGGNIKVSHNEPRGTVFVVRLPK